MKRYNIFFLIVVLVILSASCAHNPYKSNFVAEKDLVVNNSMIDNLGEVENPTLFISKDMSKAVLKMRSNGYVLVGTCEFENGLVSYEKAIEQAKSIDAQFVIVQKENTGNYTGYYPKKFNTGFVGRKIPKNKSDFVDIPYLVKQYGYVATFWSKKEM